MIARQDDMADIKKRLNDGALDSLDIAPGAARAPRFLDRVFATRLPRNRT
jgi:hypothetical protein